MADKERDKTNNGNPEQQKQQFLFPLSKYYGEFNLPNLAFDANLQEFAQKIFYVCNLETNGKVSPEEAYEYIKNLWHQLKTSKQELWGDGDIDEP
jgi:hypothetical protein